MATRSVVQGLNRVQTPAEKATAALAAKFPKVALSPKASLEAKFPVQKAAVPAPWSISALPAKTTGRLNIASAAKKLDALAGAITTKTINQIDFKAVKDVLPNTLGELLEIAMIDLAAAEKLGLKINMDAWVDNVGQKTCSVCLAGSVIAGTIGVPVKGEIIDTHDDDICTIDPSDFTSSISDKLEAINDLREGDVGSAVYSIFNTYNPDVSQTWIRKAKRHPKLKEIFKEEVQDNCEEHTALYNAITRFAEGTLNHIASYSSNKAVFRSQMARLVFILKDLGM